MDISTNYNDYHSLDIDDLEQIYLHTQKIIKARQEAELYAVQMTDPQLLEASLRTNQKRLLNEESWDAMNFKYISWDNHEFIDMVMALPEFRKKEQKYSNSLGNFSEQLIASKIFDVRFAQYFYNHPVLSEVLEKAITKNAHLHYNMESETIDFLLDKKLITFSDNLLVTVKNSVNHSQEHIGQWVPYLEYAIKHNKLKGTHQEFQELYEAHWSELSVTVCRHIQKNYLVKNEMPLNMLFHDTVHESQKNRSIKDRMKDFVLVGSERFINIISFHPVTPQDIELMCPAIVSILSSGQKDNLKENMIALIKNVHDYHPEHFELLKSNLLQGKNASKDFKKEVGKIMLYMRLDDESIHHDEINEQTTSSKLKI